MGQPGPQPIKLEEGEGAGSRMASAEKNRWWRKRCGAGQPMGMGSREHPASEPCWGLSVCVGGGWDRGLTLIMALHVPL